MISCELFLEDEEIIYVVKDSVEERTQKIRLAVHRCHFFISFLEDSKFLLNVDHL